MIAKVAFVGGYRHIGVQHVVCPFAARCKLSNAFDTNARSKLPRLAPSKVKPLAYTPKSLVLICAAIAQTEDIS